MKLTLHRFELPLRHPFTIARGTITVQPTLIVELEDAGLHGFGEATENRYYGHTVESMMASLEATRPAIEAFRLDEGSSPADLWDQLHGQLAGDTFAQCALDSAAYDLWGKKLGQPVYRLWGLALGQLPMSSFTIGIDTVQVMVEKLGEVADWPVIKVKLGTPEDLEIIRTLRRHTNAVFRVDANCGWTASETVANAQALAELGVEFIEQPLPADCWDAMRQVYQTSPLPLVADESCVHEADVERCRAYFHGVNIKLVKCGGLTPARRMIDHARRLGLRTMVGCMTESTVGISAAAQLLPLVDYADLDGALLLARDIATGVQFQQGRGAFPAEANGCGVKLL